MLRASLVIARAGLSNQTIQVTELPSDLSLIQSSPRTDVGIITSGILLGVFFNRYLGSLRIGGILCSPHLRLTFLFSNQTNI